MLFHWLLGVKMKSDFLQADIKAEIWPCPECGRSKRMIKNLCDCNECNFNLIFKYQNDVVYFSTRQNNFYKKAKK